MFDFAALKQRSRLALHGTMAVPAVYEDSQTSATPGVTVRWHNKLARNGKGETGFDAEIIEGIDRLVFQESNLALAGITLRRNGRVTIDYKGVVAVFTLEAEEPQDGPENVYWSVSAV